MARVFRHLIPMRETWMEFLTPDFKPEIFFFSLSFTYLLSHALLFKQTSKQIFPKNKGKKNDAKGSSVDTETPRVVIFRNPDNRGPR